MGRSTRRWVAALAVVIAAGVPAAVAGAQTPDQQLADAQARIDAVAGELDRAEDAAEGAEVDLADADRRLTAIEAVVNDVAAALRRQRAAVSDAGQRLAEVEEEAEVVRASLEARAAAMFKQGAVRDFDVLLSAGDAEEALARSTYLRALTLDDAATSESLAAAQVAVEVERERFSIEEERLDEMLTEQRELLADVERLRDSRALAAADARARVKQLEGEQDDLEAESERLEQLIRDRQAEAPSADGPAPGANVTSGGYAWAFCGPVTSEYGPRWGRMHQGIDVGGGTGTPIGASKAGRVIFAGWQGGYGNLVLIDHGDGVVTAYAHQNALAVSSGRSVSRGETIGYVGSTGNVTGPHLHQEFRVNGSPVDPRQYLSGSPC
ncbi:MAG: peptidoglycan DD-metalloendopeptidase family protein [Actinobacteria bacterium]|nr:peptidoglycan DD-metalloendopeptidase family protein [Actinomycetota bacterium]